MDDRILGIELEVSFAISGVVETHDCTFQGAFV